MTGSKPPLNRRDFLLNTGMLAAGLSVLHAASPANNSKINLGLIGCGDRGNWIMDLFLEHGGYNVVAVADYFQDKVDAIGDRLGVPAQRRFTTLTGYKKLLECNEVDAVVIQTPPYFHPAQAQAAVEANKHVFLAKPVAVDVPGCQSIEASGRQATQKNLCFLVDYQTRVNEHFIEAIRRVHNNAIGDYVFGEAITHTNPPPLRADPETRTPEARLLNWVFDIALSGDAIVEQQIHTLDVVSWIMDTEPLRAVGTGGHKVRTHVGDCWDHYTLVFEYPNQFGIAYSGRQFNAHGTQPSGYRARIFGTDGVLETAYGGQVLLRSDDFYNGNTGDIYRAGAVNNIAGFYKTILERDFTNETVSSSVRSNLVAILGRTAAHENQRISWQELMTRQDVLEFDATGLKH